MSTWTDLGDEDFVSLTTYRRSGEGVATPVWVVEVAGALHVWTPASSGKVKRLRHDDRVQLAPCGRRGSVPDGAPRLTGRATVSGAPQDLAATTSALRAKYGVEYRVVTAVESLVARLRRRDVERVVLQISAVQQ